MQYGNNAFEYLKTGGIIALFSWISFFPQPIQDKYNIILSILLLSACFIFRRKPHFMSVGLNLPMCIFIIAMCISILFSLDKYIAFKAYLNLVIPLILINFFIISVFNEEKSMSLLAKTITICGILVASMGILESMFRFNPIYEYFISNPYYERFIKSSLVISQTRYAPGFVPGVIRVSSSTQYNPTILAAYLLGCLPFNFFVRSDSRRIFRFLGNLGLILGTLVITINVSRSVFLGLAFMVISYFFLLKKYREILAFLCFLIIFVTVCTYLPHPFDRYGFIRKGKIGENIQLTQRLVRVTMTKHMVIDHPFAGLGLQNFRIRFCEYLHDDCSKVPDEYRVADNMYLTILSETGAIGFIGFLILIICSFKNAYRHLKTLKISSYIRKYILMVLLAFIGLLVSMSGFELLYWHSLCLFFFIIVSILNVNYISFSES